MPTSTSTQRSSSASPAEKPLGPLGKAAVIAVMAVGSVMMWLGVPFGLIYGVSKMVKTTQPTMGPYLIILVGVPLGMTLIGRGLGALDRYYTRRTTGLTDRYRPGWLKSMRGDRKASSGQWKVLDIVMIWSVSTAAGLMGLWFLFFAGSSIG